jgi:hypothetical protein
MVTAVALSVPLIIGCLIKSRPLLPIKEQRYSERQLFAKYLKYLNSEVEKN